MSSNIKQKIAKNFYNTLYNKLYSGRFDEFFGCFSLIQENQNKLLWRVNFPMQKSQVPDINSLVNSQKELVDAKTVRNVCYTDAFNKHSLDVELEIKDFVKDVLESDPTKLNFKTQPQKIIVEFSSPNIAKPFHVGHLRSTILGNALANIKQKLGNDVVKINYLGDWGTQFGLIKVGLRLENYSDEKLEKEPIKTLFEAYVKGNREAERNQDILDEAKQIFAALESGEEEVTKSWEKFRLWTAEELSNIYQKLGVFFDEYNWESDYKRKEADIVLKILEEKGILKIDSKGRKVAELGNTEIPLIKSDNTTLYLMRDLMAVLDRKSKHNFDEMYYVVENGQNLHFTSLVKLAEEINLNEGKKLVHVKFGRIHGMSTRKGKVMFLSDILEEAERKSYEQQKKSKFTKISLETRESAAILGVSSVIINDLKQRRLKDYDFSWDKVLQTTGDTGTYLQYCHCRLCSLADTIEFPPASECDPEALTEPEAINLIVHIAKFEEALWHSNYNLEPYILVKYLFSLTKAINTAFKVLYVKNSEKHVAAQRLLLFRRSREVINEGLKLLGLKVLTRM